MADTLTFKRGEDGLICVSHDTGTDGFHEPGASHYGAMCLFVDWLRGGEGAPLEPAPEPKQ